MLMMINDDDDDDDDDDDAAADNIYDAHRSTSKHPINVALVCSYVTHQLLLYHH